MLGVPGVGEAPISISGDPSDQNGLEHTLRTVGSVTAKLAGLGAGDAVSVRTPFGTPWPVEAAVDGDLLLVAGGIGLAPLSPVIHHVLAHRESYRRVILLYGARTPSDLIFRGRLDRLAFGEAIEVAITVDRADTTWTLDVGMVTRLIGRVGLHPAATTSMICGPEIMMKAVARDLLARGLDPTQTYVTMERNMHCGAGFCGHCQFGPEFVCKDGPVFPWPKVADLLLVPEV
jgi:NAD(P)H-flavin reductase